jgi:hypothetical protein
MIITASTSVSGFGQITNSAPAATMVSQAWAISQIPLHDERAASGAHSSSVKKSFGFTRAATAMRGLSHLHGGMGRRAAGRRFRRQNAPPGCQTPSGQRDHQDQPRPMCLT